MKDSGIEWIGQIPQNWEVVRLKYILHERNESNNPIKTDFILSLTNEKGVIPYSEKGNLGNVSKENISGYKLAYPNDLVLNSMNVVIGSVGISNYFGAISPVYYALYADKNADIKFYNYIFQTSVFQNSLKGLGNGILEIRMRIPMQNLNNIFLPFPPLDEQRKISEFLDIKCGEIDDLRKGIKEKIANLKAYKSSLITKAVTGKLAISNEKLAMKDSGISWIGEIPQNWEVTRIKYCGIARNGLTYTPQDLTDENGILVLRSSNIKNEKIDLNDNVYVSCKVNSGLMVKNGDILICSRNGSKELVGKNAIIENNLKATFGAFMMLFRCDNPKYMFYVLNSEIFANYLGNFSTTTINQLTNSNFGNIKFPLPPLEEQKRISEFLDKKCKIIDDLIANLNRQNEVLSEYKKSLIYECVTGRLAMSNE
ncbi:restriction endonuclease subunit S [Campylobacter sp. VBCF_05 NA6]|nr:MULTISPECIES: restriction endonuclease subunit S [unclassified Campylobacter]MDA3058005.1 restriction endonuclease subunit S [Campylobacter sp. VBCF_04 NA7]MDA3059439.1 restriction endonuclease subunit S [Campylobacter sp. VBCF_05 NA6]